MKAHFPDHCLFVHFNNKRISSSNFEYDKMLIGNFDSNLFSSLYECKSNRF